MHHGGRKVEGERKGGKERERKGGKERGREGRREGGEREECKREGGKNSWIEAKRTRSSNTCTLSPVATAGTISPNELED